MGELRRHRGSRRARRGWWLWLALPLIATAVAPALAQQQITPLSIYNPPAPGGDPTAPPPGQSALSESVLLRSQPDYDPPGIHTGGFVIFPKLQIGEKFDDNIRDTDDNRLSDFGTIVAPSLTAESTWSRHALGLQAFGVFTTFAEHSSEDSQEGGVNATGRLDITDQDYLSGFLSYSHEVQPRSEPDDTGEKHPSVFDRYLAEQSYAHRFSRIEVRLDTQFQRLDYLQNFDNDRDRSDFSIGPRVSYLLSPSFIPFIQATYLNQAFDAPVDRSGFDRDDHSFTGLAGVTFDIGPVISGEVAAGAFHTEFDDPAFDPVTNVAFQGSLTWNVTTLTTITGSLSRQEIVTTETDNSSALSTRAAVRVDHQLMHNVLIGAGIGYRNDNYQGTSRVDNQFDFLVGASYLLNRNASISVGYEFTSRDSNIEADDFYDNVVQIGVDLHM